MSHIHSNTINSIWRQGTAKIWPLEVDSNRASTGIWFWGACITGVEYHSNLFIRGGGFQWCLDCRGPTFICIVTEHWHYWMKSPITAMLTAVETCFTTLYLFVGGRYHNSIVGLPWEPVLCSLSDIKLHRSRWTSSVDWHCHYIQCTSNCIWSIKI